MPFLQKETPRWCILLGEQRIGRGVGGQLPALSTCVWPLACRSPGTNVEATSNKKSAQGVLDRKGGKSADLTLMRRLGNCQGGCGAGVALNTLDLWRPGREEASGTPLLLVTVDECRGLIVLNSRYRREDGPIDPYTPNHSL